MRIPDFLKMLMHTHDGPVSSYWTGVDQANSVVTSYVVNPQGQAGYVYPAGRYHPAGFVRQW